MRRTTEQLKKRVRTKKQIISDFLEDLVKFKVIDLDGVPFETYLESNFNQILTLFLDKLYETEEYNGAIISTLDAFYHFCNYLIRFDPKTKKRIWNSFVQEQFIMIERNRLTCYMAPRQHGKLINDNCPVMTIVGWKRHGDLDIGDYVFSPSGEPVMVVGLSGKTPSNYLIKIRNGESIRCHGSHEWGVWDRNLKRYVIKETKDMVRTCLKVNRSRYIIPRKNALKFDKKYFPVDPYYLGLWLGDGHSHYPSVTHSKEDTVCVDSVPYDKSNIVTHPNTGVITTYFGYNGLLNHLRELNLLKNKHIPRKYFLGSVNQRLELLAGLIDSDGSLDKKQNRYRFINTNYKLIKDVEELVYSLGLIPRINKYKKHSHGKIKAKKDVYAVCFVSDIIIPTRLSRKRLQNPSKVPRQSIISVEYKPDGSQGNCIQVNSEDGMYLVGKTLIPTHNSFVAFILYPLFKSFLVEGFEAILCSNTPQMTKNNFRIFRKIIDGNELLLERKSTELGRDLTWSEKEIEYNDGYIQTLSVGGTPRSGTFVYAAVDDPLRDDNKYPDEFIVNFILGQLLPTTSRNRGRIVVVGTPQSKVDPFHTLMRLKNGDTVFDGGYSDKKFYCKRFQAITDKKNKKVLVPEVFTYEQLMFEKEIQGEIVFNREYMCECIEDDTTLFPYSLIKKCTNEECEVLYKGLPNKTYFIGVDVATSAEASADYSAYIVLEIEETDDGLKKTIRHITHVKGMSVPEQIDTIQSLSKDFNNAFVLVEKNNVGVAIIQELQNRNVNVESFVTDRPKKMSGIRFLSNEMRQGRLVIPSETYEIKELRKELENYGVRVRKGKEVMESLIGHDDLVDALWICNLSTQEYGGSLPHAIVQD